MGIFDLPKQLWQRHAVVIGVETIDLAGRTVPLSFSIQTILNRRISKSLFISAAWGACSPMEGELPTEEAIRTAAATARATRHVTVDELYDAEPVDGFLQYAREFLALATRKDTLLVTHGAAAGLSVLVRTVEEWFGTPVRPLTVVDTSILERARREGLRAQTHISNIRFYRHIAALPGEPPDLVTCWAEQSWRPPQISPSDRLFSVLATSLIYQHHFGGRYIRDRHDEVRSSR